MKRGRVHTGGPPPEVERRYWDPAGIANARICHSLVGCGQNYTCYTIYTRELLHSPPLLSYYHAPPAASSPALTLFLSSALFSPGAYSLASSLARLYTISFLTSLPSLALGPPRPPFHIHHHHQHPPIRHPSATYIAARNAESYSVSLDSLKQVLMSCTPTPRSSPTAYPLATEHSSGILVLPSTPQSPSSDSLQVSSPFLSHSHLYSLTHFLSLPLSVYLSLHLHSLRFSPFHSLSLYLSLSVPILLQLPSFRVPLRRTVEFAITADTLLMPNWS